MSESSDIQKQPSHLHSLKQLLSKVSTTPTTTTGKNLPIAPIQGLSFDTTSGYMFNGEPGERNAPVSIHNKGICLNFE